MRHKTSKKLFTYWNNLRGDRFAPDRREIEPSDIRDILGDTFILEIDRHFRTISFRLAGTRLCNIHGRELKGVGFLGLWDEIDNLAIFEAVKQVYNNGKACTISLIAESAERRFAEYEMLLLPLQTGEADAIRVLGVSSAARDEVWLGLDPVVNNRLKTVHYVDLPEVEFTPPLAYDPLSTQSGHAYHDQKDHSAPRKVGHLTVYEGGISS
ncbi:MAG: PAS domain-containing protein [Rhizobiaceae bacterium]|nr:PAS domain-containing protein [Rhizobiaceae bacterium]